MEAEIGSGYHQDGSSRKTFDKPPVDELAEGPVWLLEEESGRCYLRVQRAELLEGSVVLIDDDGPLRMVPVTDVRRYQCVTVDDPTGTDPYGRALWDGLEAGETVVFVWTTRVFPFD